MVLVDGSVMEAFKVSPRDRVQQRLEEQILLTDIPVPRGGGRHGPGSAASSSHSPGVADEAFTGFFFYRTFPRGKKCAVGSALGVRTGCGL